MSHNALSTEQRSANSLARFNLIPRKQAKIVHCLILKLSLTTLAAIAICLPNLNQAAHATNLGMQKSDDHNVTVYPTFLPRILNLIPNSLNRLVGFADANKTAQDQAFLDATIIQEIVQRDFDCVTSLPETDFSLAPNFKSAILAKTESESAVTRKTHRVSSGETLSQLAQQYGVSLTSLTQLNQINDSDLIVVDRQLIIPEQMLVEVTVNQQPTTSLVDNLPDRHVDVELGLASTNLKAKLPPKKPPLLRPVKTNKSKLDQDPYIVKLKEEIEQMRAEYRQQQQQTDDAQITSKDAIKPELSDQASESPQRRSIATSTANTANQNPQTSLSLEDNVALQLPPLPSSEEYLPSAFDGYTWPAQGVLTSGYGWRWGRLHGGIDIAAPIGTPVVAAASGEVISAGWNSGGYGNLIEVQHLDGSITLYAHNHRILVSSGQRVRQGQQIAEMGNTGRSTGSHLHFEIRPRSQGAVNPLAFLN